MSRADSSSADAQDPWHSHKGHASRWPRAQMLPLVLACVVCCFLLTTAAFVAVSALHDQPFRAPSGFAALNVVAAASTLWSATTTTAPKDSERNLHD